MNEEMQKSIVVNEDIAMTLNNKLLAERLISAGNEDTDQVSVCSCSCLDLRNHKYNYEEGLLPMNAINYNYSSPTAVTEGKKKMELMVL